MVNTVIDELAEELRNLKPEEQSQVLSFVRDMKNTKRRGISGKEVVKHAGLIPHDDLMEMKRAIEEHCEQVDPNEW